MNMEYSTDTPQGNMDHSMPFKKDPLHQSRIDLEPIKTCSNKAHHSCEHCGLLFETMIQMNRHMLQNCTENRKRLLKEDFTEIPTFQKIVKRVRANNEEEYIELVDKFIEEGLSENWAEEKAEKELWDLDSFGLLHLVHNLGSPLGYHTLIFDLMSSRNMYLYNAYIYTFILFDISMKLYKQLMTYFIGLQDSNLHNDMLTEIIDLVDRGRSIKSAINRVMKREYFDELFEDDSRYSESETEQESETSDENEADNNQDNKDSSLESEDDIPLSQLRQ